MIEGLIIPNLIRILGLLPFKVSSMTASSLPILIMVHNCQELLEHT
jgi:hypothetical protein